MKRRCGPLRPRDGLPPLRPARDEANRTVSGVRYACVGWLAAVSIMLLLAGCHSPPPQSAPPPPALPPSSPRGNIELDLSAVPSLDPAFRPALRDGSNYRSLTARECQC